MAEEGQVIGVHNVEEFDELINKAKESGKLIVVDFTATWCPPCRFIAPVFLELAKAYVGGMFLKVDVDESKELAERHKVCAMPTFIFLKEGEEVERIVGGDKVGLGRKVSELIAPAAGCTAAASTAAA